MDRRIRHIATALASLALASAVAACGSTATAAPSTGSATGSVAPSGASGQPAPSTAASAAVGASAGVGSSGPSAPPSAAGVGSPGASSSTAAGSPAAAGSSVATAYPLPPIGQVHTFTCATLLPTATLTKITKWPSAPIRTTGAPKPEKGRTNCPYASTKFIPIKGGFTMESFDITITLLTGGARTQFDQTWEANQASPLLEKVDGVGDAARWQAVTLTLAALQGSTGFTIQISPYPLNAFTPAAVEKVAAAIGRAIAPHL